MAANKFVNKKTLIKFHDAIAWLMQIVMFMILGLLVNFKEGFVHTKEAFLVALILIFVARPIAVFLCDVGFKRTIREKLMISWVGLLRSRSYCACNFSSDSKRSSRNRNF